MKSQHNLKVHDVYAERAGAQGCCTMAKNSYAALPRPLRSQRYSPCPQKSPVARSDLDSHQKVVQLASMPLSYGLISAL